MSIERLVAEYKQLQKNRLACAASFLKRFRELTEEYRREDGKLWKRVDAILSELSGEYAIDIATEASQADLDIDRLPEAMLDTYNEVDHAVDELPAVDELVAQAAEEDEDEDEDEDESDVHRYTIVGRPDLGTVTIDYSDPNNYRRRTWFFTVDGQKVMAAGLVEVSDDE